mmetsp:Transcript_7628/g.26253  ORF Transcript_7628/g.26253 Transcript_7628/m.26253 type:complete len:209 (-) Transcript_7628:3410-4036(-)
MVDPDGAVAGERDGLRPRRPLLRPRRLLGPLRRRTANHESCELPFWWTLSAGHGHHGLLLGVQANSGHNPAPQDDRSERRHDGDPRDVGPAREPRAHGAEQAREAGVRGFSERRTGGVPGRARHLLDRFGHLLEAPRRAIRRGRGGRLGLPQGTTGVAVLPEPETEPHTSRSVSLRLDLFVRHQRRGARVRPVRLGRRLVGGGREREG